MDRKTLNKILSAEILSKDPDIKKVEFPTAGGTNTVFTMADGTKLNGANVTADLKSRIISGAVPVNTAMPQQDIGDGTMEFLKNSKGVDIAKNIGEQLLGGDITLANIKKLLNNDPTNTALLPKTKATKDAERIILQSSDGTLQAGTPLSFSNPLVITILLALFLIAAYFLRK